MAKLDRRARLVYFNAGKAWICTNMAGSGERSSTSFLDGGGTMGALMRAHDFVIIENLANLDQLSRSRVTFLGLPLPLVGGSGSPIRAAALVPE